MEFFKSNKFTIISILILSACGYLFLYIQEEKNENILIEPEEIKIEEKIEEVIKEPVKIYVDVAGEVINPGVYVLDEFSRVNDLIIAAGGVTEEANLENVNLAYMLTDGIKITIPNKKNKSNAPILQNSLSYTSKNELININEATIEELMTLSGIGESIAEDIIEYREIKGRFKNKEDIMNVSGIGESKYNKIKNKIVV